MILVIDNYDSFTYNLVHMVAGAGEEVHVVRNDRIDIDQIRELAPDGILISPGPGRPEDAGVTTDVIRAMGSEIPILGVCLGHQAIGQVYGGSVVHAPSLMHGKTSPVTHDDRGVFEGVQQDFTATRYHSLVVSRESVPECLEVTAWTADGVIMGLRHRDHPVEGIQFHPESFVTTAGGQLIENWLKRVRSRKTQEA
ncbi:MAG: aminodeoxychorismate/anthranilate synthase component II [Rhodothermales bacterium]|nr:aminodeoxychorismate/anthranilate synthase component II [Rhodothermales bacterium]MBO6779666.1 aminodeoxychorismate/anthranilate synthase component II [Rhodothermales bacterium]